MWGIDEGTCAYISHTITPNAKHHLKFCHMPLTAMRETFVCYLCDRLSPAIVGITVSRGWMEAGGVMRRRCHVAALIQVRQVKIDCKV